MISERGWRAFLGPLLLLVLIYSIWFVRYLTWRCFESVEPLFTMLIFSYLVVLLLAMFFLKKDSRKTLPEFFKVRSYSMVFIGMIFAFLFQATWFLISLGIGGRLEFLSFPSLKGYEGYAVHSMLLGFALYLTFAVFGAFVEEVTFRGYIQSRIASRHGHGVGILVASLFFSLQHIHIFEPKWVEKFFQTQFIYVFCFGVFVGYFFSKGKGDIWSVFAFHALTNFFNVSLPIQVIPSLQLTNQLTTITSFILITLLFHYSLTLHKNGKLAQNQNSTTTFEPIKGALTKSRTQPESAGNILSIT